MKLEVGKTYLNGYGTPITITSYYSKYGSYGASGFSPTYYLEDGRPDLPTYQTNPKLTLIQEAAVVSPSNSVVSSTSYPLQPIPEVLTKYRTSNPHVLATVTRVNHNDMTCDVDLQYGPFIVIGRYYWSGKNAADPSSTHIVYFNQEARPILGLSAILDTQVDPVNPWNIQNTPTCSHTWKETQGIFRTYKDCTKCGIKHEDTLK